MSEITPNTPNPVREDAYVEELAEKLGIDPQYIPKSPVWRNEEEIKAIAEMFANMAGGGSSGGALLVNTQGGGAKAASDTKGVVTKYTCDKTAGEMYEAMSSGRGIMFYRGASFFPCTNSLKDTNSNEFLFWCVMTGDDNPFYASGADDYPSVEI